MGNVSVYLVGAIEGIPLENEILFRIKEFHVYEHSRR